MRMIQTRTNTNIACLEEIAQESGWITRDELYRPSKAKETLITSTIYEIVSLTPKKFRTSSYMIILSELY